MPNERMKKFKGIIKSLLSPKAPPSGTAMAEGMMEIRKNKLEMMGPKKTGGMFDIIYKKKKEKEKALSEIEY